MKIKHRVPVAKPKSDPISEDYQAEVDRATAKLEKQYEAAQRRLEAAIRKAEAAQGRAKGKGKSKSEIELWALVELRRKELAQIAALMHPSGAGVKHRGRASFTPVPRDGGNRP